MLVPLLVFFMIRDRDRIVNWLTDFLPEERLLSSVSVQELVEQLHGEVICCEEETDELVEYLMVGAMTADSAITYFRERPNKAVITAIIGWVIIVVITAIVSAIFGAGALGLGAARGVLGG